MTEKCTGTHSIYVAEVVGIPAEGRVVVITVCRNCDHVAFHAETVSKPSTSLILKNQSTEKE
jgi:hypothetical protein